MDDVKIDVKKVRYAYRQGRMEYRDKIRCRVCSTTGAWCFFHPNSQTAEYHIDLCLQHMPSDIAIALALTEQDAV